MRLINKLIFTILLGITTLFAYSLNADSAAAVALSGSYSLRAAGYEANYWNPATLYKPINRLLLLNTNLDIGNNLLSTKRYNDLNGTFLTEADKDRILDDLAKSFRLEGNVTHNLLGFAYNRIAISSKLHINAQGKLSSRYFELIMKGNEFDRQYSFDESDTRLSGFAYLDLTFGVSPYSFEYKGVPIHTGLALSYLRGLASLTTEKYKGEFFVSNDGAMFDQEAVINTSLGGSGFKAMLGAMSQITPELAVGLSLDNIPGYIKWDNEVERRSYFASADSVYIADLDELILHTDEVAEPLESFTQRFPLISRLSAIYQKDKLSLSLDWSHAYKQGMIGDNNSFLALGAEYYLTRFIPFRCGVNIRTRDKGYSFSYGSGIEAGPFLFNYGIKTHNSIFLSPSSNGLGFAVTAELDLY
ncbi:MAG: hypothetical protein WC327_03470 [Candidatus Cloacimonadia bacterium]|jgi:hypothetical protein